MKRIVALLMACMLALPLMAQVDTTKVNSPDGNSKVVLDVRVEANNKTNETKNVEVITDDWGDTTKVRIGNRTFKVVDDSQGSHVKVEKSKINKRWSGHFNAHWSGVELGMNTLQKTDYSLYNDNPFMDLNYGKSLTLNVNFAEWAFKNDANNFALVTGLGFSFMDFTFDDPMTIKKYNGRVEPVSLNPDGLKKSKLNVNYLTAPLMLELKTPLRLNGSRLYLAGGVIGGLNIGSHTKYKYGKDKYKDRSNFYLNDLKYDITGRIGLGDFCIFMNYSMTPLFRENRGPEVYPLTFGIAFPNM